MSTKKAAKKAPKKAAKKVAVKGKARSAKSGEYVSKAHAAKHPGSTVVERG